jgi:DNA polymerase I-like protein with 3'-5' exonuclease and polymerase domains
MLLQRMDDRVSITRPWFEQYRFHLVQKIDQVKQLVDMCIQRKLCSLDLETTGVDNRVYPDEYFNDGRVTRHGIRTVNHIAGICISFDGQHGYYIPVGHEPEDSGNLPWDPVWDEITRLVNGCRIIFHNAKFDCEFLYPVTGKEFWRIDEFEDTFLMAKVISPLKGDPAGLKPLAKKHYSVEMVDIDELFTQERKEQLKREKRGYNFAMMHPKEGLEYGCSDGIFTYKLQDTLRQRLSEGDMRIYNLEKNFCNIMREMERNRVHIDVERVNQLHVECKAALQESGDLIRDVIEHHTGKTGKWLTLNVGSVTQLSNALLYDQEGMQLKPTKEMIEAAAEGGFHDSDSSDDDEDEDEGPAEIKYSLKDEAIKSMQRAYGEKYPTLRQKEVKDPATGKMRQETMFDLILENRHYAKMNGSYVEKLVNAVDKNGDVRPNFNQMGTDTARLSCRAGKIEDGYSGVNFQGIPRDSDEDKPELFKQIRTCIAPRPGWILVKLDYSGEELRVVTNLSGDPIWTKSFLYEDGDVHSITARTLFGKSDVNKDERNRGKRCNFAFIYGGGAGAIQRNIGCSIEDAQRHMQNLKNDVPVLMGYVEHQKKYAKQHKCIYTAFGRKIPIPTIESPIRGIRAKAERCAINYTIQSTSADVIKFAMCYVDKQLRTLGWKDRCRYVLTVHDEVVFEIKPEYLMEIVRKLDEWMTLPWKLPKAHGRPWVVPLLTEPGIDIHWRARFDYFKMVDGTPAKESDIVDGEYKGKLKKDEFFADGRIYQKVPDFLGQWIKRLPPPPKHPELPAEAAAPEAPAPAPALPPAENPAEERPTSPPPPLVEPPKDEPKALPEAPKPVTDISIDVGDIDLDTSSALVSSGDVEIGIGDSPAPVETKTGVKEPAPAPAPSPVPAPAPPKTNGTTHTEPGQVFRWTIRAELSQYNMRKLHAACIASEGPTALRIISSTGDVLIDESSGIRVNPVEFQALTKLFGLG